MRIAFFGLPIAALCLAQDGHEIVLAAISRKGAPGTRRLRARIGEDRIRIRPVLGGLTFAENLRAARPELIVSWFWTTRIPMSLVEVAPLGGFGVHPSLLPRWRGPDPCFWAIDAGDSVTGVTAHRLAEAYDTGAILGARELAIDPRWDAWSLARALDSMSIALLRSIVRAFADGRPPSERRQDAAGVTEGTEAPAPTEQQLEIDWHREAASIVRRVRAAAPQPGAWTFLGQEALIVTRAEIADVPRALEPGEATEVEGRVVVRAADRGVALLSGRVVDDDDRERLVDAAEIVALLPH